MIVVISLGGSAINPEKPDVEYIKKFCEMIKKSKHKFGIVCGGGKVARHYANASKKLGASEFEADEIAIISTKQNAELVKIALGDACYPKIIDEFKDVKNALNNYKVILMGGTIPGITTDTDAVLLAEKLNAKRFINLSNVDGIYDLDPRKNKNAKKYDELSIDELIKIANIMDKREAGTNFVFDIVACKLMKRSNITAHFIGKEDFESLKKAIDGKKHKGTIIK